MRRLDRNMECERCEGTGRDINRFDGPYDHVYRAEGIEVEGAAVTRSGYRYNRNGPPCPWCNGYGVVAVYVGPIDDPSTGPDGIRREGQNDRW